MHNHLRWWWGWSAWPSGILSRCSSIWRRCCCGSSRTRRSCCLRGVDSESRSGNAPCGQCRVHTLDNELRGLQFGGRQRFRCKIDLEMSDSRYFSTADKNTNSQWNLTHDLLSRVCVSLPTLKNDTLLELLIEKWLSRKRLSNYSSQTTKQSI